MKFFEKSSEMVWNGTKIKESKEAVIEGE